jgi:hypothetical protein
VQGKRGCIVLPRQRAMPVTVVLGLLPGLGSCGSMALGVQRIWYADALHSAHTRPLAERSRGKRANADLARTVIPSSETLWGLGVRAMKQTLQLVIRLTNTQHDCSA